MKTTFTTLIITLFATLMTLFYASASIAWAADTGGPLDSTHIDAVSDQGFAVSLTMSIVFVLSVIGISVIKARRTHQD